MVAVLVLYGACVLTWRMTDVVAHDTVHATTQGLYDFCHTYDLEGSICTKSCAKRTCNSVAFSPKLLSVTDFAIVVNC